MLVLTRGRSDTVKIGDDITVRVLSFYDDEVRLGIEAPRDISIDREEVRRRKQIHTGQKSRT